MRFFKFFLLTLLSFKSWGTRPAKKDPPLIELLSSENETTLDSEDDDDADSDLNPRESVSERWNVSGFEPSPETRESHFEIPSLPSTQSPEPDFREDLSQREEMPLEEYLPLATLSGANSIQFDKSTGSSSPQSSKRSAQREPRKSKFIENLAPPEKSFHPLSFENPPPYLEDSLSSVASFQENRSEPFTFAPSNSLDERKVAPVVSTKTITDSPKAPLQRNESYVRAQAPNKVLRTKPSPPKSGQSQSFRQNIYTPEVPKFLPPQKTFLLIEKKRY